MNINPNLSASQVEQLVHFLHEHENTFAREYQDMKGIHPGLCMHHIYIRNYTKLAHQPQHHMTPVMKEIVTGELQKLFNVNFIYPISNSQRFSPLVVVQNKNGKW